MGTRKEINLKRYMRLGYANRNFEIIALREWIRNTNTNENPVLVTLGKRATANEPTIMLISDVFLNKQNEISAAVYPSSELGEKLLSRDKPNFELVTELRVQNRKLVSFEVWLKYL